MSFNVKFKVNENLEVVESALENMMVIELIWNFKKKFGLKEDNKASFSFNSEIIKADSTKRLKDLGIGKNSVINVKTEKPLDYKPENTENSKILHNNYINMDMNMNNYGNMNMIQSSCFSIMFSINGIYSGSMYVDENMLFREVVSHFYNYYPNKNENEAIFFYKLKPIKSDSTKKLKELGIKNMSIIEFITNTSYNSFNFNYENMGMNPHPFIGLQNYENMNIGSKDENINIVFNYKIVLEANKNTTFSDLSKRFCSQVDVLDRIPKFYLGSQKIKSTDNQTLSQLNIYNNSEIFVLLEKEKYLNVFFCYEGKTICVGATKNTRFSELCKKFCLLAGIRDIDPRYIVNSHLVQKTENRTLAELNIGNQKTIEVLLNAEVIGG